MALAHPPSGIVVDSRGHVVFVDFSRHRLLEIDRGGRLKVRAEDGARYIRVPHHLSLDARDNVYTAPDDGQAYVRVSVEGDISTVLPAPGGPSLGIFGMGGDPVARDARGCVYLVHERTRVFAQILRLQPSGCLEVLAGGACGSADGAKTAAAFELLHGATLACAADGSLYLTDAGKRVRRVQPDGRVTTLAGGSSFGFADGSGADARFAGAMGLALEADGAILVADFDNRRIRRVSPAGVVTTIAGSGAAGARDGPALQATFEGPSGVAVDRDGAIYILDHRADDPRVRVLSGGQVSTLAVVDGR